MCVDPKLQIQDVSLGTVAAFGTIFSLNASKVHQTPKFYPFSNIPSHVMCSHLDLFLFNMFLIHGGQVCGEGG